MPHRALYEATLEVSVRSPQLPSSLSLWAAVSSFKHPYTPQASYYLSACLPISAHSSNQLACPLSVCLRLHLFVFIWLYLCLCQSLQELIHTYNNQYPTTSQGAVPWSLVDSEFDILLFGFA